MLTAKGITELILMHSFRALIFNSGHATIHLAQNNIICLAMHFPVTLISLSPILKNDDNMEGGKTLAAQSVAKGQRNQGRTMKN